MYNAMYLIEVAPQEIFDGPDILDGNILPLLYGSLGGFALLRSMSGTVPGDNQCCKYQIIRAYCLPIFLKSGLTGWPFL